MKQQSLDVQLGMWIILCRLDLLCSQELRSVQFYPGRRGSNVRRFFKIDSWHFLPTMQQQTFCPSVPLRPATPPAPWKQHEETIRSFWCNLLVWSSNVHCSRRPTFLPWDPISPCGQKVDNGHIIVHTSSAALISVVEIGFYSSPCLL